MCPSVWTELHCMLCTHTQGVAVLISICVINLQSYSSRHSTLHITCYCTKLIYPDSYHVIVGLIDIITEHLLSSYFCLHFVVSTISFPVSWAKCTSLDSLYTVYNCVFFNLVVILNIWCCLWLLGIAGYWMWKPKKRKTVKACENSREWCWCKWIITFWGSFKETFLTSGLFFSLPFWQSTSEERLPLVQTFLFICAVCLHAFS